MFDENLAPKANTSAEVLKEIKEKVDNLYNLKLISDKAEKEYKNAKNELASILEDAEVDKVQGDTATVSLALKTSVTVPKDEFEKQELFDYINSKYGAGVLHTMLTINARSFSSWFNKEVEAKVNEGDLEPNIANIKPYEYYSLSMRKRNK